MLRINDIYTWLLVALIVSCPIGMQPVVKNVDEVVCMALIVLAFVDSVMAKRWSSYRLFWVVLAIMGLYLIYSLAFCHFNIPTMICMDALLELKPFAAFSITLGCMVAYDKLDRRVLRLVGGIVATLMSVVMLGGYRVQEAVAGHVAFAGMSLYMSVMIYLLCSLDENNRWTKNDLLLAMLWLCCGLLCGRSKYYAEFILAVFFIFVYKPGVMRGFKVKHMVMVVSVVVIIVVAVWHKFEYYFILGNSDTFDPNDAASFARPALYLVGFLVMCDYFPLGSGLASFATYASEHNYSGLYYEYNLDKVWGLSPTYSDFICDAYYPSLAQFGVVGLLLFICFWRYVYTRLRIYIRQPSEAYRNLFVVGVLLLCFMLIECTTGTGFTTPTGLISMAVLGILCRKAMDLNKANNAGNGSGAVAVEEETKRIKI